MNAFMPILDALQSALPLIIAALVPILIAKFNQHFGTLLPKQYYPIVLPIAGAVVAGTAKAVGFDVGDFNPETASLNMWQTIIAGALTGHAMVGMHQIKRQFTDHDQHEEFTRIADDDKA